MRHITLIIVCIYSTLNLFGQNYFSKHIDIGNTGLQDLVLSMVEHNDTIYFTSFNVLDVTDTSFTRAIQLCSINKYGQILNCKVDVNHFTSWPHENLLFTENDSILVFGTTCCGIEAKLKLIKFDKMLKTKKSYLIDLPLSDVFIIGNYDIQEVENYFIIAAGKSSSSIEDPEYLSFLVYIDKISMNLVKIDTLPFNAVNKIYEELFVDKEGKLTAYYLLDRLEGDGNFNSRGFIRYNEDMEVEFIYRDTLEISTGTSSATPSNGLLLSNGTMVNTQKYIDPNPVFPDHISDYDIVCTNRSGETVWRYNTPGHSPFGRKIISNMSETKDGDILGCGSIRWFKGLKEDDYTQPIPNNEDEYNAPYIIKIDGKTGEEIWEYALIEYNEHGHQGPSYLKEFFELSDGSLFGGGSYLLKDSLGQVYNVGDRENSWFLRLPPDGCHRDLGCDFENVITAVDDLIPVSIGQRKPFKIFPNPASDKIIVSIQENDKKFDVSVYSMSGVLISIHQNLSSNDEISIASLAKGNYLMRIFINHKNIQNEIFIKY